jgi:hypothetical protein
VNVPATDGPSPDCIIAAIIVVWDRLSVYFQIGHSKHFLQLAAISMQAVFVNEVSLLECPSTVVLREQRTKGEEMSRNGYSPVEFVLSACHCEEHHAFRKLWATPKEAYEPKQQWSHK